MSGSLGVRVSGPLEDFAEGFATELAGLGYSSRGGEAQLRLPRVKILAAVVC